MKLEYITAENMYAIRVKYSTYKKLLDNYKTVTGSYDKSDKTIIVEIDEKRYNIIDKKAGNKLQWACEYFIDNSTKKRFDHVFRFFTDEGLQKQIKEFEKKWNCTIE